MKPVEVFYVVLNAWLVLLPCALIVSKHYDDGVFGRLGLTFIAFAAALTLMQLAHGDRLRPLPQSVLLISGFAIYLTWHAYRYWRRVRRLRKEKEHAHIGNGTAAHS